MADKIKVTVGKKCYRDGKVLQPGATCMVDKDIADKTDWMEPVKAKSNKGGN